MFSFIKPPNMTPAKTNLDVSSKNLPASYLTNPFGFSAFCFASVFTCGIAFRFIISVYRRCKGSIFINVDKPKRGD